MCVDQRGAAVQFWTHCVPSKDAGQAGLWGVRSLQWHSMAPLMEGCVATDIAKFFKLPKEKIVHVRDRAFNDRSADDLGA